MDWGKDNSDEHETVPAGGAPDIGVPLVDGVTGPPPSRSIGTERNT